MPSFRDRDSGLSQEHGINLDETGEIVELVGCFFWTSARSGATSGCESVEVRSPQSPLPKEGIGPEASRDCWRLVALLVSSSLGWGWHT